ncbi:hypothetical protein LguiB_005319 [Lonicera macranthoides]
MELLDSVQPNTPSWDEGLLGWDTRFYEAEDIEASSGGVESAYGKTSVDEGWWTKMTNGMFLMGMYTHQTKGSYTNNVMSLGRFARNVCTHSRLNNNCNWFQGLERFIDETYVDENAFAVLEFRFGFTSTLKMSWHNNYWCDPNLIEHNLKEVEGSQQGFYVNMVIKAFLFFPEELPNTACTNFDNEDGQRRALSNSKSLQLKGDEKPLEIIIQRLFFRKANWWRPWGELLVASMVKILRMIVD